MRRWADEDPFLPESDVIPVKDRVAGRVVAAAWPPIASAPNGLPEASKKDEPIVGAVAHYPDLTEVEGKGLFLPESSQPNPEVNRIKTEFVFYLAAGAMWDEGVFISCGFVPIARMNNWWPSHRGEIRPLTLWWKRNKNFERHPRPQRRIWMDEPFFFKDRQGRGLEYYHHLTTASSGCGFKIGELPFRKNQFYRFFTLYRIPLNSPPEVLETLKTHNYKHVDTGTEAEYWVNGWDPATYDIHKEFAFFNTSKQQWGAEKCGDEVPDDN